MIITEAATDHVLNKYFAQDVRNFSTEWLALQCFLSLFLINVLLFLY